MKYSQRMVVIIEIFTRFIRKISNAKPMGIKEDNDYFKLSTGKLIISLTLLIKQLSGKFREKFTADEILPENWLL